MKPWAVDTNKMSTYDLELLARDQERQERYKTFAMDKACEVHRATGASTETVINAAVEFYRALTMDWSE